MEKRYLFHNTEEGRAAAVWSQRPGMMQASERTPPTPTPEHQGRNEPLPAPTSPVSALLCRSWQEHWCELLQSQNFSPGHEIQQRAVKHILKICSSHEKRVGGGFPFFSTVEGSCLHCLQYIQIPSSNKIFPSWSISAKNLEETLVRLSLWDDSPYWEK